MMPIEKAPPRSVAQSSRNEPTFSASLRDMAVREVLR
jgi:hypothetical protein